MNGIGVGGMDFLRKVGGVVVNIGGQEVLHGCGIEHDGAGSIDGRTSMEGAVDIAEYARLCCDGKWRLENSMPGMRDCAFSIQGL